MSRQPSSWQVKSLLLVSFIALLLFSVALAQQTAPPIDYSYTELSTGVLEIQFLSSTSLRTVQFSVYGDGRVEGSVVGTGGEAAVLEEFTHQLDADQVSDLVDQAVDSGLVDFETNRFLEQLRDRGEPIPQVVDGGSVLFKINLDYLARGADAAEAPYSHSFILDHPGEFARRFPDERSLEALQRITQVLEEIYWTHRRQR